MANHGNLYDLGAFGCEWLCGESVGDSEIKGRGKKEERYRQVEGNMAGVLPIQLRGKRKTGGAI